MRNYSCQCVWNNVDNIIQNSELKIDYHSHAKDLYDMKYVSREDDDCSHQPVNFIKYVLGTKESFGVFYFFTLHCYLVYEYFSK